MLSVGDILQKERSIQGLTLLDIEKKTKIRVKFLQAIEKNNWGYFSSKVYIIGILKNYSRLLGLDEKKVLAFFRRDYEKKDELRFKQKISQRYLAPETRQILRRGFMVLILFFVLYFGYQLKQYFSPPKLVILSPKKTTFFREDRIKISAKTEKDATVVISGERIYQNTEGVFEYTFPLNIGKNILIIDLTGANGRKTKIENIFIRESK
jgi:cytoskeletal protein RodZ